MKALLPWALPTAALAWTYPVSGHPGLSSRQFLSLEGQRQESPMETPQLGTVSPSLLEKVLLRPPSC